MSVESRIVDNAYLSPMEKFIAWLTGWSRREDTHSDGRMYRYWAR